MLVRTSRMTQQRVQLRHNHGRMACSDGQEALCRVVQIAWTPGPRSDTNGHTDLETSLDEGLGDVLTLNGARGLFGG